MFEEVTIVGVGLLGASLGLAMKKRGLASRIVGVGRADSPSLEIALQRGAIDSSSTDLLSAISRGPDLVVLCTPVRQFPAALRQLRTALPRTTLVTDVGSTKAQVMRWAVETLQDGGPRFVGSHPMAGSEKRGPTAARDDLYEGALCLLCDGPNDADGSGIGAVEGLWKAVGMRTLRLEPAIHDQWVAMVSHLPHAVAFSLMNAAAKYPEMLEAAAGGFLDTTRIASSDVDMWTDIFLTNREAVAGSIDAFMTHLAALRGAIMKGEEPAIRAALGAARAARESLVARRKGPVAS